MLKTSQKTKSYTLDKKDDLILEVERLKKQALFFFQNEIDALKSVVPKEKGVCLDYGCGTGAFTNLLNPYFSKVIGLDINQDLLGSAESEYPDNDYYNSSGFSENDLKEFLIKEKPSFIFMRFVLQHMNSDEWKIIKLLSHYSKSNDSTFVICDVDDSYFESLPSSKFISENIASLSSYTEKRGGNRILNGKIDTFCSSIEVDIIERIKVNLKFSSDNITDFYQIIYPALKKVQEPSVSNEELRAKYNSFFYEQKGVINLPFFYTVI